MSFSVLISAHKCRRERMKRCLLLVFKLSQRGVGQQMCLLHFQSFHLQHHQDSLQPERQLRFLCCNRKFQLRTIPISLLNLHRTTSSGTRLISPKGGADCVSELRNVCDAAAAVSAEWDHAYICWIYFFIGALLHLFILDLWNLLPFFFNLFGFSSSIEVWYVHSYYISSYLKLYHLNWNHKRNLLSIYLCLF